ncbi:polyisoprenoid diphosphate/phosphate phosphohydrolase PLPP6 [Diachasmimorpha longicaudata]|uniref:polyisoprenoid diphosphate/phosphate phosphohydrolase PLPP6 n=1 Tax=Diachasmimorpha longicaudata TaxID=58733 RepID=UPI0030B8973F
MEKEKREVPSLLRKVLAVDAYVTDVFVKKLERISPLRQLRVHCKLLEISAHGIPWLAGWLALLWIVNSKNLYQMQVNLFLGLLMDIFLIAILKAVTRRRRPMKSDDPFAVGPDKYSFPSGHASRTTFITYFFINLWPVSFVFIPPLLAWTISVCISRLLMRRHHLLDIIAGIVLGLLNGLLIGVMYLEADTCLGLVSWLTDEKLDGGEYHV